MYPFGVLDENVKRLKQVVEARGLVGRTRPPDRQYHPLRQRLPRHHQAVVGRQRDDGRGGNPQHPAREVPPPLINDGVRVGISSRGVGNGKVNENGILVIGESYKLITFDAVADPSTVRGLPGESRRVANGKLLRLTGNSIKFQLHDEK
jgi:hypothetical protein